MENTAVLFNSANEEGLRLPYNVVLVEQGLLASLFSCRHDWSRPFQTKDFRYPEQFPSHQACLECGATRFFNTKTWTSGPLFRRLFNARGR